MLGRCSAAHGAHALGDDAQGVDVEARIGLVEERDHRFEQRHLQDLVALAFPPGEAVVEVAFRRAEVHAESVHPLDEVEADLRGSLKLVEALSRSVALAQNCTTETPAMASGYWKARKIPARAPLVRRSHLAIFAPFRQDLATRVTV